MTRWPESISCPRCLLSAPDLALLEPLQQTLNRSYALHSRFMDWPRPERSLEEVESGLRSAIEAFHSPTHDREKRYYLVNPDRTEVLGCIGIELATDPTHYLIGYWASARHTGHGYMSEALRHLLPLLNLHPVRLTTSQFNEASQRLALRSGFRQIESRPGERYSDEHGRHDTLVFENTLHLLDQGVPLRPKA